MNGPKDPTSRFRQRRYRARLNEIAQDMGYKNWNQFCTAVLHGRAEIPEHTEVMDAPYIAGKLGKCIERE